jgi:hypothetical protein
VSKLALNVKSGMWRSMVLLYSKTRVKVVVGVNIRWLIENQVPSINHVSYYVQELWHLYAQTPDVEVKTTIVVLQINHVMKVKVTVMKITNVQVPLYVGTTIAMVATVTIVA